MVDAQGNEDSQSCHGGVAFITHGQKKTPATFQLRAQFVKSVPSLVHFKNESQRSSDEHHFTDNQLILPAKILGIYRAFENEMHPSNTQCPFFYGCFQAVRHQKCLIY